MGYRSSRLYLAWHMGHLSSSLSYCGYYCWTWDEKDSLRSFYDKLDIISGLLINQFIKN